MGAVFAVSVQSGKEVLAKEMLKQKFLAEGESLIKGIYALETHTEFLGGVDNSNFGVNEKDITTHLTKERFRSAINSKQSQLDVIRRYDTVEFEAIKKQYRKEIRLLQKELTKVRNSSKNIHSVFQGYILVELNLNSKYMPNHIYHLINETLYVRQVLSNIPIPEEEFNEFISNMDELLQPEVVIKLDKQKDYALVDEKVSGLIKKLNEEGISSKKKEEIKNEISDLQFDTIRELKKVLKKTPALKKEIKAFVNRGYETVSMPLATLEKIYTEDEVESLRGKKINKQEFVSRVEQLSLFDMDVMAS